MATVIGAYEDELLETVINGSNRLVFEPSVGNVSSPPRRAIYIGHPDVGLRFQRKSAPLEDTLELSVVDLGALNGGSIEQEVTSYKLALTEAELDDAVAGAPLNLGYSILSGVDNARTVWIEGADSVSLVGIARNLVFRILDVEDYPL
jgi:hypothetical protein